MDLPSQSLSADTLFHGRYRIIRPLKTGGMGAVYEVVDTVTNGARALKVMLPSALVDPDMRARFSLEVKVTGAIESEHLARVLDAGVDEASDSPFLVMELLRGEDLGKIVANRGALPPEEVVSYLRQTALALDKTHAEGIVHRDIKPENLFITTRDDGSPCLKVLDFGIAKLTKGGDAQRTRALGTPLYMAPEQARGDKTIGPATDIYALAHVAYTLLAGEPYWKVEQEENDSLFQLLSQVVTGIKEPPSARAARRRNVTLPADFDTWLLKATAPDPSQRFGSATAAVEALATVFGIASHRGSSPSLAPPAVETVIAAPATTPMSVRPPGAETPKDPSFQTAPTVTPPAAVLEAAKQEGGRGKIVLLGMLGVVVAAALVGFFAIGGPESRTSAEPASSIAGAAAPVPSASQAVLVAPVASEATADSSSAPMPSAPVVEMAAATSSAPAASASSAPAAPSASTPSPVRTTPRKTKTKTGGSIF